MIKKTLVSLLSLFTFLTLATPVNAVCPVCTIAIGGGVLLSRYLGVDDLVIGVWVGGLVFSLGFWTATYIKKQYLPLQKWLIVAAYWVMTYFGLEKSKIIGHPLCKIFGYDKITLGMIIGSASFLIGFGLDGILRGMNKKNQGKAFFPYQKVICPVAILIIATLISLQLCNLIK